MPSKQKLYTLRGVSADCVDRNVINRLPVRHDDVLILLQLGETGVYATARILNVNDQHRSLHSFNTGLIQTPL